MRAVKMDLEESIVSKIEQSFCFAFLEGKKVKVRSLTSVLKEAILTGMKIMIEEQITLRKLYGSDLVFLSEKGVMFPEDLVKLAQSEQNGSL